MKATMRYWEWELLYNTIDYVERCIPNHSLTTKDEVVDKVYQTAHKTLKLFHADHPKRSRQTPAQTDRDGKLRRHDDARPD